MKNIETKYKELEVIQPASRISGTAAGQGDIQDGQAAAGYRGDLRKRSMGRESVPWRMVWNMTGLVCKGSSIRNENNFMFYKFSDK